MPAYAAYQDWLGRGEILRPMAEAWAAGDRKGAGALVPDSVVDELLIHGTPESCQRQVQDYVDAGITTPVIALVPPPELTGTDQLMATLAALGPSS